MGIVALFGGDERPPEDLGLRSLVVPVASADARRVQRAESYQVARSRSRRNVQIARLVHLGETADVAQDVVSMTLLGAERRAARCPEERDGLDAIAQVVTMCAVNIVGEQGAG